MRKASNTFERVNNLIREAFDEELSSVIETRSQFGTNILEDSDEELLECRRVAFENLHFALQCEESKLLGDKCRNWFSFDKVDSDGNSRNLDA
jgi:Tfp pilus assembly pilus retraction ATPase PilT